MSSRQMARCGTYSDRPKFCRDYPTSRDVLPAACTYSFRGDERVGTCQPEVCQEQACCAWPRKFGEPEGEAATRQEGGRACKHLVWHDVPEQKAASDAATFDAGALTDELFSDLNRRDY